MNEKDYSQPVAYDAEGRPLYAHPPTIPAPPPVSQPANLTTEQSSHVTQAPIHSEGHNFDPRTRVQYGNEPGVRHVERAIEPEQPRISDEVQERCEKSKKHYPFLNLSEGEYVILDVRRHPIGLILPVGGTIVGLGLVFGLAFMYGGIAATAGSGLPGFGDVLLIAILVGILIAIFGYFATWVYLQNKFFMTNESVIQEIQHSIFSKHEQTVSLGSIEDASFKHTNFIQTIFNYGTIRLSTEGEETTYRFQYVSNPKKQVAILNNAVEAFKNGRPVND